MSLRTECQEADQPKMQRPRVHVARPLALPSDSSTTIYTDSDEYLFEPLRSVDILNEEATNDSPDPASSQGENQGENLPPAHQLYLHDS
ncbi:hypothetical protein E4U48_003073 [Claviceps purpurea]|nr:hypothetical protein E4U48_003073 [Claviceps purpurea]